MVHHSSSKFTQRQRSDLYKLGVMAAQIDELESVALPIGRAWLGRPPRLRDVRSELQALSDTMRSARNAMSRLLDEGPQTPAQRESADRVVWAIHEMGGDGETIKKALNAVVLIYAAAENATREMPQEERRNRTASIKPVVLIAEALSSGYAKGQSIDPSRKPQAWLMEYIRQRKAKRKAVLPGFFKPSSSPGSAFRKIVGICYKAMNQGRDAGPERAIKAYIAARKRHRQAQHDNEELGRQGM